MQIKGEWYFVRPSELQQLAATPDHLVVEGQGLLPKDWRPGDFPLPRPNSTGPNFPVTDMTKGKDGVWTSITPLPSGTFTYAFFVDGPAPTPREEGDDTENTSQTRDRVEKPPRGNRYRDPGQTGLPANFGKCTGNSWQFGQSREGRKNAVIFREVSRVERPFKQTATFRQSAPESHASPGFAGCFGM